ncbi:hypothetical protein DF182_09740 [Chitinophaga flava]|uniref:Uncharacterized protein n=1 Tax=Chitinophaga flava TaxID=2259036 RepID=A0A365Y2L2_9BACT|nr:hypothetical protein DF182_09740 [Chitinophaga flava]
MLNKLLFQSDQYLVVCLKMSLGEKTLCSRPGLMLVTIYVVMQQEKYEKQPCYRVNNMGTFTGYSSKQTINQ